jgi:hypothetical protein
MRNVWILICTVGLVCSCSRDDEQGNAYLPESNPLGVVFSGDWADEEWAGSGDADTRVGNTDWTNGDSIGLYMLDADETVLDNARKKNMKYTYNAAAKKFGPATASQTLYYPVGTNVKFLAYYPYNDSTVTHHNNKVRFDFTDQHTKSLKDSADFCFHRWTDGTYYNRSSGALQLTFSHKFSKIRMTVKQGTGGPSLSDLVVTLTGMPKTATVDLAALALDKDDTDALGIGNDLTDIIAHTVVNTNGTEATVEAIVAPHTNANHTFVFTTAGDKKNIYDVPSTMTFEPGKVYTYEFSLITNELHDNMTNCYMVVPGDSKTFKVSRAYKCRDGAFTNILHVGDTYTNTFDAAVIWEDADVIDDTQLSVSGTGNTAEVTVKTNNVEGNAVVGIYKPGESTPVWSYHIWVTNYTGAETATTDNNYVFMDRNLGATANDFSLAAWGLLYQWGRKDPFPGSANGTAGWNALSDFKGMPNSGDPTTKQISSTTIAAGIIESIQNPSTFFGKHASSSEWLPGLKSTLWNTPYNEKTLYDPCPSGWRVPRFIDNIPSDVNSPWYNYKAQSYGASGGQGMNWGEYAKYPAAGCRDYSEGYPYLGGNQGRYWTTYTWSTKAFHFYFNSGWVMHYTTELRSYGFSIRCAKE